MKTCKRCAREFPLAEFYRHPAMADGHLNICKECKREEARSLRDDNIEEHRARDRRRAGDPGRVAAREAYAQTEEARTIRLAASAAWRRRNPEKRRAHGAVARAIGSGDIKRNACERCRSGDAQAHHEDYARPLDVTWLCPACHAALHKEQRERMRGAA